MHAYCFASGEIGFGPSLPYGALPIAKGEDGPLHDFISGIARHAYDNQTLLVPGIPEAEDEDAALKALIKFRDWISGMRLPKGIETIQTASRTRRGLKR